MSYNISQSSSFKKFHDDPKFIFHQETVVHFNNVGIVIVTHDDNLEQMTKMMAMNFFFLWKGSLCQILGLWGDFQLYFQEEKMTEELYTNNNVSFVLFVIYTGAAVVYGVDR